MTRPATARAGTLIDRAKSACRDAHRRGELVDLSFIGNRNTRSGTIRRLRDDGFEIAVAQFRREMDASLPALYRVIDIPTGEE